MNLILMPVWVFEETDEGYRCLLGSEPRTDADQEWIPKSCVASCVYAPSEGEPKFALMTLKEVPEEIRKKNPNLYRNLA